VHITDKGGLLFFSKEASIKSGAIKSTNWHWRYSLFNL